MSAEEREEESSGGGGGGGGRVGGEDEKQRFTVRKVVKARDRLRSSFGKSGKRSSRRNPPPPPPPPYDEDLGKGCYLCFMPPRASPELAPSGSPSDPSGPKPPTYYEFLKSMIENNDFYSPECNVHRDIG